MNVEPLAADQRREALDDYLTKLEKPHPNEVRSIQ